jgi:hypothetical protein
VFRQKPFTAYPWKIGLPVNIASRFKGGTPMKEILVSCDTKDVLDWHIIKPLQGNYKKRTPEQIEKLCALIIKRGIRFPSFITRIAEEVWAIDTHGRLLTTWFL